MTKLAKITHSIARRAIKVLGNQDLSKSYFFNIRGQLRKSGKIPTSADTSGINGILPKRNMPQGNPGLFGKRIEILASVDASEFTEDLKSHWKQVVLPLIQRLVQNGGGVTLAFLSDPPVIEVRKAVSKG